MFCRINESRGGLLVNCWLWHAMQQQQGVISTTDLFRPAVRTMLKTAVGYSIGFLTFEVCIGNTAI